MNVFKSLFMCTQVVVLLPALAFSQDLSISQNMDKSMNKSMDMNHNHSPLELPKTARVPKLTISLSEDDMTGYNLHLQTADFQLESPINSGNHPVNIMEGHAHLYINGTKIQRIYAQDVHVSGKLIKEGMNQISVTLNSHGHNGWQKDGKAVVSTIFINTKQTPLLSHIFSTFPVVAQQETAKQ